MFLCTSQEASHLFRIQRVQCSRSFRQHSQSCKRHCIQQRPKTQFSITHVYNSPVNRFTNMEGTILQFHFAVFIPTIYIRSKVWLGFAILTSILTLTLSPTCTDMSSAVGWRVRNETPLYHGKRTLGRRC